MHQEREVALLLRGRGLCVGHVSLCTDRAHPAYLNKAKRGGSVFLVVVSLPRVTQRLQLLLRDAISDALRCSWIALEVGL